MKYLILTTVIALFPTCVWGLSIDEIEQECTSRKGNEFALNSYADSIKGQRLEFPATIETVIDNRKGSAYIDLLIQSSLSASTTISPDVAADLRVGSRYLISATLGSLQYINAPPPAKCLHIAFTDTEFSVP